MDRLVPSQEATAKASHAHLVTVVAVVVSTLSISVAVVALRLWCRRAIRALGLDDLTAIIALLCIIGCGSTLLPLTRYGLQEPDGIIPVEMMPSFFQWMFFNIVFYLLGLFLVKMTFLLHYYRIMSVSDWRWIYLGAIIALTVWGICQTLIFFLQCIPLESTWNSAVKGKCISHRMVWGYVSSSINIFTDLAVAALPIPVIWQLNLRRSQKILVTGVFGLGCFSIGLAIIRLKWVSLWSRVAWENVRPSLWSLAEVSSAMVCACIPTFKPLLVRINELLPHHKKGSVNTRLQEESSDGDMESNVTMVRSKEGFSHGHQRTVNNSTYGTETYITANQHTRPI